MPVVEESEAHRIVSLRVQEEVVLRWQFQVGSWRTVDAVECQRHGWEVLRESRGAAIVQASPADVLVPRVRTRYARW